MCIAELLRKKISTPTVCSNSDGKCRGASKEKDQTLAEREGSQVFGEEEAMVITKLGAAGPARGWACLP